MIIRKFQKKDVMEVSSLLMWTFKKFNGSDYFDKKGIEAVLDLFDPSKNSKEKLLERFKKDTISYVAEEEGEIIGMIRGNSEKISGLFVHEKRHKKGVGSKLVECFEAEAIRMGSGKIKVRASLFATPLWQRSYKKLVVIWLATYTVPVFLIRTL